MPARRPYLQRSSVYNSCPLCQIAIEQMSERLTNTTDELRRNFWFLPLLMLIGGLLLFVLTLALDYSNWSLTLQHSPWLYTGGPDGARDLLMAMAGAMVAIGTVVFSTMMLVLTLATSQYGHRLIGTFMYDTANQVVLGIFMVTFVYLALVLHMVGNNPGNDFVPHVSITTGFALAVISAGMLIYFTHHIATLISAPRIIAGVGEQLDRVIIRMYPHRESNDAEATNTDRKNQDDVALGNGHSVLANSSGYVQTIDRPVLIALAREYDGVLEVASGLGEYVFYDGEIARFYGQTPDAAFNHKLLDAFQFSATRTAQQDLIFATNQISEIAVRALSPALNDPYTALDCINRIGAGLARLAQRPAPNKYNYDEDKQLRLILELPYFADMLDAAFTPIRNYGRTSVITCRELLLVITKLGRLTETQPSHEALRKQADRILAAAEDGLVVDADKTQVRRYHALANEVLTDT